MHDPAEDRTTADETALLPLTIRIQSIVYFAPVMMLVTAVILAGTSPAYLGWTLAVPVLAAIWIHRLRTVITADGIVAVRMSGRTEMLWDHIKGLQFRKWGAVRAVLNDDTTVPLPAVSFRDLPLMSAASSGRIPDPYVTSS